MYDRHGNGTHVYVAQSIPIQYLRTTVRCMTVVLADAPWALLSPFTGSRTAAQVHKT